MERRSLGDAVPQEEEVPREWRVGVQRVHIKVQHRARSTESCANAHAQPVPAGHVDEVLPRMVGVSRHAYDLSPTRGRGLAVVPLRVDLQRVVPREADRPLSREQRVIIRWGLVIVPDHQHLSYTPCAVQVVHDPLLAGRPSLPPGSIRTVRGPGRVPCRRIRLDASTDQGPGNGGFRPDEDRGRGTTPGAQDPQYDEGYSS